MEPAFYRGDILFLWNPESEPYVVGDITVYKMSVLSSLFDTVYYGGTQRQRSSVDGRVRNRSHSKGEVVAS